MQRRNFQDEIYPVVDKIPDQDSGGEGPGWIHSSSSVVQLHHRQKWHFTNVWKHTFDPGGIQLLGSYPKEMPHEHGEADGQGGRAQASVAPLIGDGEDADDQLQGEEDLHGGGHAQADAWLQLKSRPALIHSSSPCLQWWK